ncbi:Homocysteine-binding domain [Dillenia turbinata]|uniref:Homocysteine-binding domain n=1 Tax=Dillenia turbinata TaxID=194707 RepID=A0AAN8Z7V4_9MAGN
MTSLSSHAPCGMEVTSYASLAHLDYLEAGANIIISASYQATIQGFVAKGLSVKEGEALPRRRVEIARGTGDYGDSVTKETLKDFHRRRVQVLADSGADLIAFETIPNKLEAQLSLLSKDGVNVVSGDPVADSALIANSCSHVVAVGINCTPPRFIHGLILSIRQVTTKPILIYLNSGETYDGIRKIWVLSSKNMPSTGVAHEDFVSQICGEVAQGY